MLLRARVVLTMLVLVTAVAAPAQGAAPTYKTGTSDYSEVSERDVFVIVGSTLRHPDDDTDPSEPLFNEAGSNLNITWGQWKTGRGTARLLVGRQSGVSISTVDLVLRGLVPGGVYSVFYGTLNPDSENRACPGVERTLPLKSINFRQKPDHSSFVAGSTGTARYTGIAGGDLLAPLQTFFTIIYHSDGTPHHPFPNVGEAQSVANGTQPCRSSFGHDAMRQVLVLVNR